MASSTTAGVRVERPAARRTRARALAVLGATSVAAVLWTVAVPVTGVDLRVQMDGGVQSIGLAAVVGVSIVVGLLGWGLLALLESRMRRAADAWTAVALAVALLSLAGPLTSAVDVTAGAVLVGLHAGVAAVLIPVLRRSSPAR